MYDTIRGFIQTKENLTKYLNDVYEKVNHVTGEVHLRGKSGNFSFQSNDSGYSFIGSLTKEKLNHNFSAITNNQTIEIIEKISDNIHFNFNEGQLSRIDFGNCFSMTEKPEIYFSSLGYLNNNLERSVIKKTSLYYGFGNDRRSLIFYDKLKECRDRKIEIPKEYQEGNYLRYELRLKRLYSLKNKLKLKRINVFDLTNPNTFNYLLDYWRQLYSEIQKESRGIINIKGQNLTWSDVQDLAVTEYINNRGGLSQFYEWIDLETRRQNFKKGNYKKYIKDRARIVTKSKIKIDTDYLINELDSKVNNTYRSYEVNYKKANKMIYMWREQRGEPFFRFQTNDRATAQKMKLRNKFKLVACGVNCDLWVFQTIFKRLDIARKALKILSGKVVKYDKKDIFIQRKV